MWAGSHSVLDVLWFSTWCHSLSGWQADVLSPASSMTHCASQKRMSLPDQLSELLCGTRCWYSLLHVYLRHRRFHFSFFFFKVSPKRWSQTWEVYTEVNCREVDAFAWIRRRLMKLRRHWFSMPYTLCGRKTSPNSSLTFVALVMAERRSRGWKMLFASRRLISLPQTTINPGSLWLISRGQRENKWQMGSGWVRYLSCAGSTPEASSLRRRLQVSVGLGPADGSWPRPRFVGD